MASHGAGLILRIHCGGSRRSRPPDHPPLDRGARSRGRPSRAVGNHPSESRVGHRRRRAGRISHPRRRRVDAPTGRMLPRILSRLQQRLDGLRCPDQPKACRASKDRVPASRSRRCSDSEQASRCCMRSKTKGLSFSSPRSRASLPNRQAHAMRVAGSICAAGLRGGKALPHADPRTTSTGHAA